MTVKDKITNLDKLVKEVKEDFELSIGNTFTPLNKRWDLFVESPSYLKNHSKWIEHFVFPSGKELEFDYDAGYERYSTHNMVDVAERIKENDFAISFPDYDWDKGTYIKDFAAYPDSENVTAFKEYVLKNNLGSFCMDW